MNGIITMEVISRLHDNLVAAKRGATEAERRNSDMYSDNVMTKLNGLTLGALTAIEFLLKDIVLVPEDEDIFGDVDEEVIGG